MNYQQLGGVVLAGMVAMGAPALAVAADAMTLANRHGCLACHALDKKNIGPVWQDVAKRYAGQADAKTVLVDSILYGSLNKWGTRPMRGQKSVSAAEAEQLAGFILTLAGKK